MIVRAVRRALIVMLPVVAGLAVAAPAQAAQAQVTLTGFWQSSTYEHTMTGTVLCSAPTAQATVAAFTVQYDPLVFASGSTSTSCAAGEVPWSLTVVNYSGYHSGPIHLNVIMSDTNGGAASVTG
ncbi:hypothetical protein [Micromonospora cathayae]|uniref:Ig-like domain-containing protein n=1 Tax=Micromonospora cathayae TaxID=3028804 RepID=A0ABY7ZL23_9ACTN|nr:hypothetical protein [Micromonospora sp. HUAS 3]WDZ83223.1 hypothetical protein PVK37_22560 [Micromonospora sp. HUAS 3]